MDALQLIAEPRRRHILELVLEKPLPAGEIASQFDVTFGAVSQHLTRLRKAGLVTVTRDGNRRIYQANPDGLGPLLPLLEAMWSKRLDALASAAEDDQ